MDEPQALWQLDGLRVVQGDHVCVDRASLRLAPRELVAVVGANGAGKSSLIRAGLGLLPASSGQAQVKGVDITKLSARARAQMIAYLPQIRPLAWPMRVCDVVALGRFARAGAGLNAEDHDAINQALALTHLTPLAHRRSDTLSGGELARTHLARALASQAPILVADEPTAALDPAQALSVMTVVADFCARGGAALVVVHDLNLALRFATRVLVMSQGQILADAPPRDALHSDLLEQAFCIKAELVDAGGLTMLAIR
ncbi:MAG: hypothetical protein RL186_1693 [Pseudomonadota bacterium]